MRYFIFLTKTYPKKTAKYLCLPDTCEKEQKLPVTVSNTNSLEARKSILIPNLTYFSLCSVGFLVQPKADYHLKEGRGEDNLHLSWQVGTKQHGAEASMPLRACIGTSIPWFYPFYAVQSLIHRTVQPSVKVKLPISMA